MAPDLTQSPQALFDPTLTWRDFVLEGVRLGDKVDVIPRHKIKGTTMERFPTGATSMMYQEGKTYYTLAGTDYEYLLDDRIKSVYEHDGWVHLTGGARFRIIKGQVVEFRLDEYLLSPIRNTPFSQIEKKFGRADKKIVWVEPVDALYTTTTFIYIARQLRVTYEDDDKTINGINIGAALNEEYQDALNGSTSTEGSLPQKKSAWWQTLFNII
jgi:hypothetical protein